MTVVFHAGSSTFRRKTLKSMIEQARWTEEDLPAVLDFFENTYNSWTKPFREEAASPVLNKIRAFTTNPLLRAIDVGQARPSFSFRWAMDRRKIIL